MKIKRVRFGEMIELPGDGAVVRAVAVGYKGQTGMTVEGIDLVGVKVPMSEGPGTVTVPMVRLSCEKKGGGRVESFVSASGCSFEPLVETAAPPVVASATA